MAGVGLPVIRHPRLTENPSLLASLSSGTMTLGALSLARSSSRTPASVGKNASIKVK